MADATVIAGPFEVGVEPSDLIPRIYCRFKRFMEDHRRKMHNANEDMGEQMCAQIHREVLAAFFNTAGGCEKVSEYAHTRLIGSSTNQCST